MELNIDDDSTRPTRDRYGFRGRTEYILVNADDEIVQRWFGPLSQEAMINALQDFLDEQRAG